MKGTRLALRHTLAGITLGLLGLAATNAQAVVINFSGDFANGGSFSASFDYDENDTPFFQQPDLTIMRDTVITSSISNEPTRSFGFVDVGTDDTNGTTNAFGIQVGLVGSASPSLFLVGELPNGLAGGDIPTAAQLVTFLNSNDFLPAGGAVYFSSTGVTEVSNVAASLASTNASVPVAASLPLISLGLLGLAWSRRRQA